MSNISLNLGNPQPVVCVAPAIAFAVFSKYQNLKAIKILGAEHPHPRAASYSPVKSPLIDTKNEVRQSQSADVKVQKCILPPNPEKRQGRLP
jgi:hypothetical protein